MLPETKVYSDFIKRNKIFINRRQFAFYVKGKSGADGFWKVVSLSKDDDGKWYADQDDVCYTKKAAVYYWLQNRFTCVNGMIQQ